MWNMPYKSRAKSTELLILGFLNTRMNLSEKTSNTISTLKRAMKVRLCLIH